MKKIILAFIMVATISINSMSQFQHSFGTDNFDEAYSVRSSKFDPGYIVAGRVSGNFLGQIDAALVKTDPSGIISWSKVYGGKDYDIFYSVREVPASPNIEEGYIAVGQTRSFEEGFGHNDILMVRTNSNGTPIFSKVFGGKSNDRAKCVQNIITPQGKPGFIILGHTGSFPELPRSNVYVILTDQFGNTIRSIILGYEGTQSGNWIEQTADGGYIIVGYSTFQCGVKYDNKSKADIYVVKLDAELNLMWDRIIGGGSEFEDKADVASCVKQNPYDNSYIITGYTSSFSSSFYNDAFLLNLSEDGGFNFFKKYGLKFTEKGNSVLIAKNPETQKPEYIVVGHTNTGDFGAWNFYYKALMFKTDQYGDLLWTRKYGGEKTENAFDVHNSVKNPTGIVFTGLTTSFGAGFPDIYLVETDIDGNSNNPCENRIEINQEKFTPCISKNTKIIDVKGEVNVKVNYKDVRLGTAKCENDLPDNTPKVADSNKGFTDDEILISPNPSSDNITISHSSVYKNGSFRILDLQGRIISPYKLLDNSNHTIVDVSAIPTGIYIMEIRSNKSELITTNKFMKK